MRKIRVFALMLALMCLALGLSAAKAEAKPVAARLVLYALDKTDIGFVELLDDVPMENLDEFTFYEDGTAVAEIRYAETPAMPALHLEGTWTHYDVAGKELYEFAFADPNTGAQVSWPLERVGHGFALDAFIGTAGNRRLLQPEDAAEPTGANAPVA